MKTIGSDEIKTRFEFQRQRQFLERSIAGLKKTIKSFDIKNDSYYLIMEENLKLIEDINGFRMDAKKYFIQYNNLKKLLPKEESQNNLLKIRPVE